MLPWRKVRDPTEGSQSIETIPREMPAQRWVKPQAQAYSDAEYSESKFMDMEADAAEGYFPGSRNPFEELELRPPEEKPEMIYPEERIVYREDVLEEPVID
jgi:hypothetical protein